MKIEKELTKLYYSIGEVAEMFDVSKSLVRYWESEFSILKPSKNRKGDRRFTKKDIENLEMIYTLVKERGFTLEGARKELKSIKQNDTQKIISKLKTIKDKLQTLVDNLN